MGRNALAAQPELPGLHAYNKRVRALQVQLPELVRGCMARLNEQLGNRWLAEEDGSFWGLSVEMRPEIPGCTYLDSCAAQTSGWGDSVEMTFLEHHFVSGAKDLQLTTCHELGHAYFRHLMSRVAYSKVPNWFREGSAVYMAGQLESKLYEYFFHDDSKVVISKLRDPASGLAPLGKKIDIGHYFQYGLVFEFLDQEPERLTSVLTRVLNGEAVAFVLSDETGLSSAQFEAAARAYAAEKLKAWASEFSGDLLAAHELLEARKFREARDAFAAIAAGGTKARHYALFRAAETDNYYFKSSGGAERARLGFEALLRLPQSHLYGVKVAHTRYALAYLLTEQGEYLAAAELFGRVGRESVEQPHLRGSVSAALTRLYFKAESYADAAAWASSVRDDGTWVMDEIRYIWGVSVYRTGSRAEGRRILEAALTKSQRAEFTKKIREFLDANP